jgi:EAL domain-containing protein (putative c-di-GMP-specific phosphodiesterase class I)
MSAEASTSAATTPPFLEHYSENDGPAQIVVCERFPFNIGRSKRANYVIYSGQVSKLHAAIDYDGTNYTIRDLGSMNGTFVNGQRITVVTLHDGDIIHIAHKEFRFGVTLVVQSLPLAMISDTAPAERGEPLSVIYGRSALQEVLLHQHVRIVFQRIVDLKTETTVGYEALGRGTHDHLSANPVQMFDLAEKCGLATQLSRLFRLIAFREAHRFSGALKFFFNVHPAEMDDKDFVNSLEQAALTVREDQQLVMEVHEDCVSDVAGMRRLRDRLKSLGIGLAYDDFGAGQSRLAELAEAPPDFLKLDMKLIRGIDQSPARQDMVGALIEVAVRLGVRVLAEGIETAEETACCRRLGCQWAQGFLFGRPVPSATLLPLATIQSS